jgi:hypothetical protein
VIHETVGLRRRFHHGPRFGCNQFLAGFAQAPIQKRGKEEFR